MNHFDFINEYRAVTSHYPNHTARPVIGITGNMDAQGGCSLAEGYFRSVEQAGGIPMIIPATENRVLLTTLLDRIDGLIHSSGADINPLCRGEHPQEELGEISPVRDYSELLLARLAYDRNIPILGICRGIQVLAVALGGKVFQDIKSAPLADTPLIKHSQKAPRGLSTHFITTEERSTLRSLLGEKLAVNSFHHQAVSEAGPHLHVTARSADGIIEAVESNEWKPIIGVQWHPECYANASDRCMAPLFRHFVNNAENFRQAKSLHHDIVTIDSHCDTPMTFERGANIAARRDDVLVDLHRMTEGGLDAVVMAAYIPQGERSVEGLAAATLKTDGIIQQVKHMVEHSYGARLAYTPKMIFGNKAAGQKSILLGIENGYAIGKDLSRVAHFRKRGVVYMTLCHNGNNDICGSARYNEENLGVTPFGEQVIQEMNRLGMMVDLSHSGERTFYETLDISSQPVVCSHSSSRALCDHPRNLTDDQLRAIARKGGVVQVCLYSGFLRKERPAHILDAIEHLNHMVNVMGIEHVGIGSDFDGDGGIIGCNDSSEMINLTRQLLHERYNEEDIRRIWGGNFLRVMQQVQENGSYK